MDGFRISGKTVGDAIQRASQKLGIKIEEIKYSVIKEGKPGLWGIGSEEACIWVETMAPNRVAPPPSPNWHNVNDLAQDFLQGLLKRMGFDATVATVDPLIGEPDGTASALTFNIAAENDIGILLGKHGKNLASLQYLVRVMVAHKIATPPSIIVDVDGRKARRYHSLRFIARRLAKQVKVRRVAITLEPMSAFERRIIHLTLANDSAVTTQSVGEGDSRKVVITPKGVANGNRRGR